MQTIVTVADQQNMLAAANHLNMTQPGVSKLVKDVENLLGATLFERSPKGVQVTKYGATFLNHARSVISEMRMAWNELSDLKNTDIGNIRIGILPNVAGGPLLRTLTKLYNLKPGILVSIFEGTHLELFPMLRTGEIDFVLGRMIEDGSRGGLRQEFLYKEAWTVLGSKNHSLANSDQARPLRELVQEKWLMPPHNDPLFPAVQSIFRQHNLEPPSPAVECKFGLMAKYILAETDLITIMPSYILGPTANGEMLSHFAVDLITEDLSIGIILKENRTPTAIENVVREMLTTSISKTDT